MEYIILHKSSLPVSPNTWNRAILYMLIVLAKVLDLCAVLGSSSIDSRSLFFIRKEILRLLCTKVNIHTK